MEFLLSPDGGPSAVFVICCILTRVSERGFLENGMIIIDAQIVLLND